MIQIFITRPEAHAFDLMQRLEGQFDNNHYKFVHWPIFKVKNLRLSGQAQTWLYEFDGYDYVFVASKHAATLLLEYLDERWPMLPFGPEFICPGSGTAAILSSSGLITHAPKTKMDSEGVLNLPMFASDMLDREKKWLIVSGVGGRRKIQDYLLDNKQIVNELDLYERQAINQMPSAQFKENDIVVVTSSESLSNIEAQLLKGIEICNLWVSSNRIKEQAGNWKSIFVMKNALDETILQAINDYEK